MNDAKLIQVLKDALEAAKTHLEYCNYGDAWERSCAIQAKLPDQIQSALNEYEKAKGEGEGEVEPVKDASF